MPFITSGKSLRQLPLFFAHCPDKPGVLSKRLKVRGEHMERWMKEKERGYGEFGMGYKPLKPLNPSPSTSTPLISSSSSSSPSPSPSTSVSAQTAPEPLEIDGSLMLFRAESLDKAWEMIRGDVYWKEGIWDKDRAIVRQFLDHPSFSDRTG